MRGLASIRELGARIEDVKVILNSHVHSDHAGEIAALRVTNRDASHSSAALVAADACERYVAAARTGLRARITAEGTK